MCLRHITSSLGEAAGRILDASQVAPRLMSKVFDMLSDLRAPNDLLATFMDELASYCRT
jgi:hypothetical protein